MRKFTRKDRSTWPYFWAHWCAFQMVALNLGVWKFKYLFHDWYKPWLKMLGIPYKKIQRFHRTHSNHHLEWLIVGGSPKNFDWEALIIDWECSRFTKKSCPRNAREEMDYILTLDKPVWLKHTLEMYMKENLIRLDL